ncbi:MAG: hypothetical protein ACYTBP_17035 [Planctomycetota bacterium]
MNQQQILEELIGLLEENTVTVRSEPLGGGGGGLCSIKGKNIFFLDTQSSSAELSALAAEAVAKIVDIENIYIRPEVRMIIEKYNQQ